MTEEAKAVLEAARKLSPEEQALIAEALLDDVPEGFEHASEEEFFAELERRDREMADGTVKGIPWEALRDEE